MVTRFLIATLFGLTNKVVSGITENPQGLQERDACVWRLFRHLNIKLFLESWFSSSLVYAVDTQLAEAAA